MRVHATMRDVDRRRYSTRTSPHTIISPGGVRTTISAPSDDHPERCSKISCWSLALALVVVLAYTLEDYRRWIVFGLFCCTWHAGRAYVTTARAPRHHDCRPHARARRLAVRDRVGRPRQGRVRPTRDPGRPISNGCTRRRSPTSTRSAPVDRRGTLLVRSGPRDRSDHRVDSRGDDRRPGAIPDDLVLRRSRSCSRSFSCTTNADSPSGGAYNSPRTRPVRRRPSVTSTGRICFGYTLPVIAITLLPASSTHDSASSPCRVLRPYKSYY